MGHPENSKNKYKAIQKQFSELAKIISQLSNLFLVLESDIRELKEALLEQGIKIQKEEKKVELEKVEPETADAEDYFPKKSEEDKDERIDAQAQVVESTQE